MILIDLHRDLRVPQISVGEAFLQRRLDLRERQVVGVHTSQILERKGSIGVDAELAGQLRLAIDGDDQHVLWADPIIGRHCGRLSLRRLDRSRGQRRRLSMRLHRAKGQKNREE